MGMTAITPIPRCEEYIKGVINVPHNQISPINYLKTKIDSEFILGVANTSDGIKTILSADRICDHSVLKRIHETIAS